MYSYLEKPEEKRSAAVMESISKVKSQKPGYLFLNGEHYYDSPEDVIQCATTIQYGNLFNFDLQINSIILAVNHYQRVALRDGERQNAFVFNGRVGNCNHHAPYARIASAIVNNWLINQTVGNAINGINGVIALLNGVGAGYAVIPFIQFSRDLNIMTQEFDDAIANIANDPRNLFYSPYHRGDARGTQLDWPTNNAGASLITQNHIMFQYSNILAANNML